MINRSVKPRLATINNARRGSALLVVLVMLGMIAALAAVISRSISGAALEVSAARASSESEVDLRAGIELGVATILKLGKEMRSADAAADLAKRRITVHVTNERARIDLNTANATVLAALLQANGVTQSEADELAANVAEWRGGSASQTLTAPKEEDRLGAQLPRLGGMDTPVGLEKEAPKQIVGSRFFFHPMQLASVPGFTKTLVNTILPLLTVANGSGQIDPTIASARVLEALPGTSPSKVEAYLEARDGNTGRDTAILLLGVEKELVTARASDGWRLQIVSTRPGARTHRSEAVIAVSKNDSEPYKVVYVTDEQDQAIR
jgi:general secretion pathway protein K